MSILCLFAVPEIGVNRNQICSDFVTIVAGLVCTDYKLIWCQGWHKPTIQKGTNESFVGGETVVLLGTFSNLPEKTNLEWNPRTVYCWVFAAWNEFIVCRQTGDGFLLVRGFCLKLHHGCCVQFVCSIITVVYPPGRKQNDPDLKNDMVFMVLCFLW